MKFLQNLFKGNNPDNNKLTFIKCSICGFSNHSNIRFCASCGSILAELPDYFDAFISYRRETASELASLIKVQLENFYNKKIFLDVKELQVGKFDEALLSRIEESPNFILVLSKNSLDRCVDKSDWLKREIIHALVTNRNIIPVYMDGFKFPEQDTWAFLPEKMRDLKSLQAIMYNHVNQDSAIRQIASYMKVDKSQQVHKDPNSSTDKKANHPGDASIDGFEPNEVHLIDYINLKSNELNNLKDKHIKEEKELKLSFGENSSRFVKEGILLFSKQINEIKNDFLKIHHLLSDYKPKNQVEAFVICDYYLDLSLYDNNKTAQKAWLRSNINCYELLSNELSAFQESFIKKEILTWTIIRNEYPDHFSSQSVLSYKNNLFLNSEPQLSANEVSDYFIEHQKRVRNISDREDKLFADKDLINTNTLPTAFIDKLHPIFSDYMNEKIAFEKIVSRYFLVNGFKEPEVDKAKIEFYFLFCKFQIMYSYVLLLHKQRGEYLRDFLDVQTRYLNCQMNRNRSQA